MSPVVFSTKCPIHNKLKFYAKIDKQPTSYQLLYDFIKIKSINSWKMNKNKQLYLNLVYFLNGETSFTQNLVSFDLTF